MEGVGSQETMPPPEGATTPKREPLDRIRPLREPTRPWQEETARINTGIPLSFCQCFPLSKLL